MITKLNSVTGMGKTYTYEIRNEKNEVMGITGRPPYEKPIYNKGSKYHK